MFSFVNIKWWLVDEAHWVFCTSQEIGWEDRLWSDSWCVEWDIKPQLFQLSFTSSIELLTLYLLQLQLIILLVTMWYWYCLQSVADLYLQIWLINETIKLLPARTEPKTWSYHQLLLPWSPAANMCQTVAWLQCNGASRCELPLFRCAQTIKSLSSNLTLSNETECLGQSWWICREMGHILVIGAGDPSESFRLLACFSCEVLKCNCVCVWQRYVKLQLPVHWLVMKLWQQRRSSVVIDWSHHPASLAHTLLAHLTIRVTVITAHNSTLHLAP